MTSFLRNNRIQIFISIMLFLTLLPLALKVNFMQNDDWYYYQTVENFFNGNYRLMDSIAPTLYLQIFMSLPFAIVFGISRLPVFTLFISVVNFFIFSLILKEHYKFNKLLIFTFTFMLFFNPLFNYSIWGYMTELYYLFFLLMALYFLSKNKTKDKNKYLTISNIFALGGFFIRQINLFYYLGTAMYFLIKRKYKLFLSQMVWFLGAFFFYEFIFPKTIEMQTKGLQFHHFFENNYLLAVIIGTSIYLSAFTLPLIWAVVLKSMRLENNKILSLLLIPLTVFIYFLIKKYYLPESISWGEFPYFENIFERKGFYPRSIEGTKYHFIGIHDLYYYWDILAKFSLSLLVATILIFKKVRAKIINPWLVLLVTYILVSVTASTFYDRYILVIVPIYILFLIELYSGEEAQKMNTQEKKVKMDFSLVANYIGYLIFTTFLAILSYQFSNDFVSIERFVWESSNKLVKKGVSPNKIQGASAWNEKYNRIRIVDYKFTYDSIRVNPEIRESFELVKKHDIIFPGNFFINPQVFLYKRISDSNTTQVQ